MRERDSEKVRNGEREAEGERKEKFWEKREMRIFTKGRKRKKE